MLSTQGPAPARRTARDASETETPLLAEEEVETDAPIETAKRPASVEPEPAKRGRPKGSKDAHPRTRTKPETYTPSKAYFEAESPLVHFEDAMADARQQELIKKQNLYQSWLPY